MKSIGIVKIVENELIIQHSRGYLRIQNKKGVDFKGVKIYSRMGEQGRLIFKHYNSFSKSKMEEFQNVLLKAYVFQNDLMDKAIEEARSRNKLESIKEIILVIRKHLRYIAEYVDSYDEILDEYKEV